MATKKILCVLIAAAFFFSFGLFSFADDEPSDSVVSLSFRDGRFRNVNVNGSPYYNLTFSSLPYLPNTSLMFGSDGVNGVTSFYTAFSFSELIDNSSVLHIFSSDNIYSGAFDFSVSISRANVYVDPQDFEITSYLLNGSDYFSLSADYRYELVDMLDIALGASCTAVSSDSFDYHVSFSLTPPPATPDPDIPGRPVIGFDPSYICFFFTFPNARVNGPNGSWASNYNLYNVSLSYGSPEEPPPVVPDDPDDPIQGGLDYEEQKNEQAYEDALEGADASAFDLSSFATSFTALFNGLNYQGTDFRFMFPGSGVVPALNMQLWPETEIPFRQWIDRMPSTWLTIARFLAWLALAWAFVHKIKALIQDINGGDDE